MTSDEVVHLTKLFVSEGADKVRLTRGEPLLQSDLIDIIGILIDITGILIGILIDIMGILIYS